MTETKPTEGAGREIQQAVHQLAQLARALPRERELAFFQALDERGFACAAPAIVGFTFRQHVDECHECQAEKAEEILLRRIPEEDHEAWLFGYRWQP